LYRAVPPVGAVTEKPPGSPLGGFPLGG